MTKICWISKIGLKITEKQVVACSALHIYTNKANLEILMLHFILYFSNLDSFYWKSSLNLLTVAECIIPVQSFESNNLNIFCVIYCNVIWASVVKNKRYPTRNLWQKNLSNFGGNIFISALEWMQCQITSKNSTRKTTWRYPGNCQEWRLMENINYYFK